MAPYAAASFAEDVATGNVAAKASISSDGNHPNRIPAPAMTATTASSTTHYQWQAVIAPSPATTPHAGARYSNRRGPPSFDPQPPAPRRIATALGTGAPHARG